MAFACIHALMQNFIKWWSLSYYTKFRVTIWSVLKRGVSQHQHGPSHLPLCFLCWKLAIKMSKFFGFFSGVKVREYLVFYFDQQRIGRLTILTIVLQYLVMKCRYNFWACRCYQLRLLINLIDRNQRETTRTWKEELVSASLDRKRPKKKN